MHKSVFLLIGLLMISACTLADPDRSPKDPRPSEIVVGIRPIATVVPEGDFFYSLPAFGIGEMVTFGGYSAQLVGADVTGDVLSVDLEIHNETGVPIDMGWAVQLIREDVGYIPPQISPVLDGSPGEGTLSHSERMDGNWTFDLDPNYLSSSTPIDLDEYRLLFVPLGWSGPVFVFRLTAPAS